MVSQESTITTSTEENEVGALQKRSHFLSSADISISKGNKMLSIGAEDARVGYYYCRIGEVSDGCRRKWGGGEGRGRGNDRYH